MHQVVPRIVKSYQSKTLLRIVQQKVDFLNVALEEIRQVVMSAGKDLHYLGDLQLEQILLSLASPQEKKNIDWDLPAKM